MQKIIFAVFLLLFNIGCSNNQFVEKDSSIILATTTSTQDSGLLDYILDDFEETTGIDVMVVAVGTGKAFEIAKAGDADVLLVHAKESEEEFIRQGYGIDRYDLMYNDFILIGPPEDPASIKKTSPKDIVASLLSLERENMKFVSRGDNSGTDKKEKALWKIGNTDYNYDNYIETGKGMGETIIIADEMLAYTLTDKATYLNIKDKIDLEIVCSNDENLFNQYGVIRLNPEINDKIKVSEADEFIDWILSDKTQEMIAGYGVKEFGEPLFIPNAINLLELHK